MKDLIQKLLAAGKTEALNSLEEFKKAASDLGYTKAQVEEALEGFSGFPLDDEDLDEITGGTTIARGGTKHNFTRFDPPL